jgi:predicted metal-dependent enzyme (double-stranded beta helix superfamily)
MPDDVFYVRGAILESFVDEVRRVATQEPDRGKALDLLRPAFGELLGDFTWLPSEFTRPDPTGGMGEGVGNYLIFRSGSRDLSLMSLVLPAGVSTPVHDHLAWGLVGLYSGRQSETVYGLASQGDLEGVAQLVELEQRDLQAGDFYELLPPEGDIHRVRTLGDDPSVSIHLLGNDIGCTWRHRYDPESSRVFPFRSGYSNETCSEV